MLFDKVNEYRKDSGRYELLYSKDAYFLSKIQAEWMYKNNKFSHLREDTFYNKENVKFYHPYKRCQYFFKNKYFWAGENICLIPNVKEFTDEMIAEYALQAFITSPGHRYPILNETKYFFSVEQKKYYAGFCTYVTPKYIYVVQTFLMVYIK